MFGRMMCYVFTWAGILKLYLKNILQNFLTVNLFSLFIADIFHIF